MAIFFFLILLNYCLSRVFYRIEKDKTLTFNLENKNSEYLAFLNYSDNYEEIYEEEDNKNNEFNFLKIDNTLSVNFIILNKEDEEPDETILNRFNQIDCKYNIELNYNKQLINFPKNITEDQIIYFVFFIDDNSTDDFLSNKIYEI